MGRKKTKKDVETEIKVEGPLTIYEASGLRDQLLGSLENASMVTLDLGEVSECDISGIQVLYSARLSAVESGTSFSIARVSPAVRDTLSRTGLTMEEIHNS